MTLPKAKKATQQKEREQLIQDIKQQNRNITDEQLSKYDIDDLRKIKMATAPKAETEKLSQVEQFDRDVRTGKFSQQYDTFRQPRMKHGGKMKKKYQSKGKVGRGLSDELMEYTAKYPRGIFQSTPHQDYPSFRDPTPIKRGEKSSITELRMKALQGELNYYNTLPKIKKLMEEEGIYDTEDSLATALSTGTKNAIAKDLLKAVKSAGAGVRRAIEERTKPQYQYGGMADMSAAPMIKQPQRKKRKASGFRTKYSKGGGVRSSKYKL